MARGLLRLQVGFSLTEAGGKARLEDLSRAGAAISVLGRVKSERETELG
mgnify:CR=1 FL=1